MEARRYDILEQDGGWTLTDGRGLPRVFLSSSEALSVARSEASLQTEPVEIHLWRNGVSVRIYPAFGA